MTNKPATDLRGWLLPGDSRGIIPEDIYAFVGRYPEEFFERNPNVEVVVEVYKKVGPAAHALFIEMADLCPDFYERMVSKLITAYHLCRSIRAANSMDAISDPYLLTLIDKALEAGLEVTPEEVDEREMSWATVTQEDMKPLSLEESKIIPFPRRKDPRRKERRHDNE